MQAEHLRHIPAQAHGRVESRHWILRDIDDLAAIQRQPVALTQRAQVASAKAYRAFHAKYGVIERLQQSVAQHGLSAS